jgi:hypothetical protein
MKDFDAATVHLKRCLSDNDPQTGEGALASWEVPSKQSITITIRQGPGEN